MPGLPANLAPLLRAEAYPHPVESVRLIETHISWVLLAGEYAYKLKKPVQYPFVDQRSAEHRAFLCAEEVRLNRRFAPDLYLDVCRITAAGGKVRMGGEGATVEHAVRMRQFDCEAGLDRLLATGRVEARALEAFGQDLAAIHARLPAARETEPWGRTAAVRTHLLENLAQCLELAAPVGTHAEVLSLREPFAALLQAADSWFEIRRQAGRVRECHGDLHARNVFRYAGRLLAFDCIEFEPAFRWIDVAEDIAFLAMDLEARRCPLHAQAFIAGYLARSGDYQACRLLRLYGVHHALVRAKVTALEAAGAPGTDARETAIAQHRNYLDCARQLLARAQPMLLLMHGLSGSGKTWLAQRLAPLLGAVLVRSDVERKRLAGLEETGRSRSGIAQALYSPEYTTHVYAHLAQCAADALAGGYTVIVDATFNRRAERERFLGLALRWGIRVRLVHCHAARDVLEARVAERRQAATDASDADTAVLAWQEANGEPLTVDEGIEIIDVDTTGAAIVPEVYGKLRALR
jgi:aminoglycoside phosphotransferase family enzyme/predicted kinase